MQALNSFIHQKYSFPHILYMVTAFTFFRVTLEKIFLTYPVRSIGLFQEIVRLYIENIFYFIILFILLCCVVSKLAKKKFFDVANFGIKVFPLMMLPPFIDSFFFGRTDGYIYGSAEHFWSNVFTLSFKSGEAGMGISILIALTLTAIASYVFYFRKSVILAAISWLISSFIIIALSTPEIIFREYADFFFSEFISAYYFFPLIALALLLTYVYSREKLLAIISNLRLIRSLMFVFAVILGSFAARMLGSEIDLFAILLISIAVIFSWEFSVFINDIYDYRIDLITNKDRPLPKKVLSIFECRFISAVFAFFALSFSIIINIPIFILTVSWLILGILYSAPPFRFRKNILGNLIIGLALVISFIMGILSSADTSILPTKPTLYFVLILLVFGSVISMIKDIKDTEGDKKYGIKNLFTIFGDINGKKITTAIMFIVTVFMPLFVIWDLFLFLIALILGTFASYIYYRTKSINLPYILIAAETFFIFLFLYKM